MLLGITLSSQDTSQNGTIMVLGFIMVKNAAICQETITKIKMKEMYSLPSVFGRKDLFVLTYVQIIGTILYILLESKRSLSATVFISERLCTEAAWPGSVLNQGVRSLSDIPLGVN